MKDDEKEQTIQNGILTDWPIMNGTEEDQIPHDMKFNNSHILSITVYSILLILSSVANITVLVLLVKRRRKNPSRINTMLMHLAIADLLVSKILLDIIRITSSCSDYCIKTNLLKLDRFVSFTR